MIHNDEICGVKDKLLQSVRAVMVEYRRALGEPECGQCVNLYTTSKGDLRCKVAVEFGKNFQDRDADTDATWCPVFDDKGKAVADAVARAKLNGLCTARLGLVPFMDGDMWCVLHGADLQAGDAAFGKTPYEALATFHDVHGWRYPNAPTSDTPTPPEPQR